MLISSYSRTDRGPSSAGSQPQPREDTKMGWIHRAYSGYMVGCVLILQLMQCVSSLSLSSQVACTYADSTCSTCEPHLCPMRKLYPLLPSMCHPSSQVRGGVEWWEITGVISITIGRSVCVCGSSCMSSVGGALGISHVKDQ